MAKTITNKELDTVVNYMVIRLTYGLSICLPYADGILFLDAMKKAEHIQTYHTHEKLQFDDGVIEIDYKIISQKEYREQKMKKLLGVEKDEPE